MEEKRWGQKGYLLTKPGAVEKKQKEKASVVVHRSFCSK